MGNSSPFGGIPFLGLGDFRQVAPVVKGQGCTPTLLASIKSSPLWQTFRSYSLQRPIRSAQDIEYTAFVDRIGEDSEHTEVTLPYLDTVQNLDNAIEFLYPPHILCDPSACLKRAFLSPKNINVDSFNCRILEQLPGNECTPLPLPTHYPTPSSPETVTYFSSNFIKENEEMTIANNSLSPDHLALLTHNGVPPHLLRLKKGCVCTLMRNMSVKKGLVKNARVIVHELHRKFVEIRVISNRTGCLGDIHCIPRIRFPFQPHHSSWTVHRLQIPLRLAYSCTFNGCVGLTLDKAVVDVREPVFAHGQLYTALSRVRHRSDARALFKPTNEHMTCNIVYKDLLL
jgi:hypothetical protein